MPTNQQTSTAIKLALAGAAAYTLKRLARNRRRIDFAGRCVVITGGSRGLGLVLARQLAAQGARLTLLARDQLELEEARAQLEQQGDSAQITVCDVTDRGQVEDAIHQAAAVHGGIDILINNAGVIQVGPLEHMSFEDFEQALDVHMWAPLFTTTAALPYMRRQQFGRIVNIASIGGKVAVPHLLPYVTSKFALVGLSDGMRAEVAKDNILVTTVCPGLMRTGSTRHALVKGKHHAEYTGFAISDSLPGLSVNVERAAAQILDACRHGDPRLTISLVAKLAVFADAVAPSLMAAGQKFANRLLPGPTGPKGNHAQRGFDSQTALAPSPLTALSDAAARRNNEFTGRLR